MAGYHVAHFPRQNKGQRRIVEMQCAYAAIDHHRSPCTGCRARISLVGDDELETRKAQMQVGILTKGDVGEAPTENQNALIKRPVRGTFRFAA